VQLPTRRSRFLMRKTRQHVRASKFGLSSITRHEGMTRSRTRAKAHAVDCTVWLPPKPKRVHVPSPAPTPGPDQRRCTTGSEFPSHVQIFTCCACWEGKMLPHFSVFPDNRTRCSSTLLAEGEAGPHNTARHMDAANEANTVLFFDGLYYNNAS